MNVVADADLAGDHRPVAHAAGAGNAGKGHQNHVFADIAVVADVDEVIDLGSPADSGFLSAPRSMVELAPISTSSSITSVPCCGNCV